MGKQVHCEVHGDRHEAFVCSHLAPSSYGLGFNSEEPTSDSPYPDAWRGDCEILRAAHDGWDDESSKLARIKLICSGCYGLARIRNTKTTVSMDDLKGLRWECSSCDDWHSGLCLDFSYDSPAYWSAEYERSGSGAGLVSSLDSDYSVIEDRDLFVRGIINLPVIGSNEDLRFGVWGSLSRENFDKLAGVKVDPEGVKPPPMFSWLSNSISEYPETLNLKMYVHVQPVGTRPNFELEETDHPLAREFHHGISPARVKEIMIGCLGGVS